MADQLLSMVGLQCKGWTFSGEDPPEKVSKDGFNIKMGGMVWTPKIDAVEIPIPLLHFSWRLRGRLDDSTIFFEGDFGDLEKFVPVGLSRRQIASKLASIFDLTGKFTPIIIGLKADLREVVMATGSWDGLSTKTCAASGSRTFGSWSGSGVSSSTDLLCLRQLSTLR